jgi:diguanylate cyclase (GGDEF)-like protein
MIGTLAGAILLVVVGYLVGARLARRGQKALVKTLEDRSEELLAARNEVQRLGSLDAVTGLANEHYLEAVLEREWRRAQRYATPLSLIMIDLDYFKAYNERLGQQAGDACLRTVADVLRLGARRPGDLVARYGVKAFVIVMDGSDSEGATLVAENLRAAVASLALPHPVSKTADHVTITLGVATVVPSREATWQEIELIARAERALLQAKELGRNRVARAEDSAQAS